MYLVPLIRANRAIAASLIFPENPLPAIAVSEVISVIGPILKPDLFPRILGTIMAMIYQPYFANYYILRGKLLLLKLRWSNQKFKKGKKVDDNNEETVDTVKSPILRNMDLLLN